MAALGSGEEFFGKGFVVLACGDALEAFPEVGLAAIKVQSAKPSPGVFAERLGLVGAGHEILKLYAPISGSVGSLLG